MTDRIPREDFIDRAPTEIGAQVHVNHGKACTAGQDTRRRLYIKRKNDGSVVAYCHNCGLAGFAGDDGSVRLRKPTSHTNSSAMARLWDVRHGSGTLDYTHWSDSARDWGLGILKCREHGIQRLINENDIRFLPGRLAGPALSFKTTNGYQLRLLDNKNSTKAQTIVTGPGPKAFIPWLPEDRYPGMLVLTEDAMSAIVLADIGVNAMAMLGAHVPDKLLVDLCQNYDTIVVWFDWDNKQVKEAQRTLVPRISALGVQGLHGYRMDRPGQKNDPKNISTPQLRFFIDSINVHRRSATGTARA